MKRRTKPLLLRQPLSPHPSTCGGGEEPERVRFSCNCWAHFPEEAEPPRAAAGRRQSG